MNSLQEVADRSMVSPAHILNSMERLGIKDTGRTCAVQHSPIVEYINPETGRMSLQPGEKQLCGGRIFSSTSTGRDIPCGLCSIRETDCVMMASRSFWEKHAATEAAFERSLKFTHQTIIYSGFERKMNGIVEQGQTVFRSQLRKRMDEKATRDAEDRKDTIRQAKKRADINRAAAAMKRGEDLG